MKNPIPKLSPQDKKIFRIFRGLRLYKQQEIKCRGRVCDSTARAWMDKTDPEIAACLRQRNAARLKEIVETDPKYADVLRVLQEEKIL